MTEDEAKTKWCPFARHTSQIATRKDGSFTTIVNANREPMHFAEGNDPTDVMMNCLGSACMAWRGKEQPWFTNRAETEFRRTGRRLEPTGADIDGYCGLAGAPQ